MGRDRAWPLVLALLGAGPVHAQRVGEAWVAAVAGPGSEAGRSQGLAGFALGFALGRGALTAGPEFLWQNGESRRIRAFAGAVRWRRLRGVVHPHLVVGIGTYAWQTEVVLQAPDLGIDSRAWRETRYLSGSVGGGLTLGRLERRLAGVLEARWHRNLTQSRASGARSFLGLSAGLRVSW